MKRVQRPRATTPRRRPTRVTVSRPADLLALVPYLLGFRPVESLVVLLVKDGQVLLTARIDLPPLGLLTAVSQQFADLADQHGAEGLVLVGFGADAPSTRRLLEGMIPALQTRGLVDTIYVDGERWWSLMCSGSCCPDTGTPYDPSSHPLAAEAVYAGLATAPDRRALEAQVGGPAAADAERLGHLGDDVSRELSDWSASRRVGKMSAAVCDFVARPRRLDEVECLRLAVLASDVAVRDVAWAQMDRGTIEEHLDLWGQVVANTVAPWEPAPLCLLGMAAWIAGNGALQNCCSERAHRIDPTYSLAALLDDINQRALPPSFWDRMATDLRAAGGLLAG